MMPDSLEATWSRKRRIAGGLIKQPFTAPNLRGYGNSDLAMRPTITLALPAT